MVNPELPGIWSVKIVFAEQNYPVKDKFVFYSG